VSVQPFGQSLRSGGNGQEGTAWVRQPDGTALRAQAPPRLGWDEATVGRFLGGVQVSDTAVASKG